MRVPEKSLVDAVDRDDPVAMRFLCDEMLQRLGRWLRAAGYDTRIQEYGLPDRGMLEFAQREARLLLTRDRKLTEFRNAANCVVLLRENGLPGCIEELSRRLHVNWLYRPFTRCLLCNSILVEAENDSWREVPSESRAHVKELYTCVQCRRFYWEGSHVRRMRAKLTEWQIK